MRPRTKGLVLTALTCVCVCGTLCCLLKSFALGFTAGDAFAAAEDGAPYTKADLAGFAHMAHVADMWFIAAALLLVGACVCAVFARRFWLKHHRLTLQSIPH